MIRNSGVSIFMVNATGMGNFRINPDFRIENFQFKHEISLLYLFTRPSFCIKSNCLGSYTPEISLKN